MASAGALFRARGVTTADSRYAVSARVYTMDQMLAYRDTWTDPLAPAWDFDEILASARTPAETKIPEKLEMSENGFKVADRENLDKKDKVVRQMQHTLNRLTDVNYDTLIPECLKEEALDPEVIDNWVARIFAKALEEPMFCGLYAKMALDIAKFELTTLSKKGVRTAIVQRAQAVYEQDRALFQKVQQEEEMLRAKRLEDKDKMKKQRKEQKKINKNNKKQGGSGKNLASNQSVEDVADEDLDDDIILMSDEDKEAAEKLRKKKLANMKLIGELLRCGLLADRVIIEIISGLLLGETRPPEVDVEMVLELLKVAGNLLEKRDGIEKVYTRLNDLLSAEPALSNRVSFAVMNLLDMRKQGWKSGTEKRDSSKGGSSSSPSTAQSGSGGDKKFAASKTTSTLPTSDSTASLDRMSKPGSPTGKGAGGSSFTPTPHQLSPENEKKIIAKMKEAAMSQMKPQEKVQETVKQLRAVDRSIKDSLIVHHAAQCVCTSTDDHLQEAMFATFLMKGVWEPEEVTKGLAWTITSAILEGTAEDAPKFFPRLALNLIRSGWTLDRLVAEVFGKVAWCLDTAPDAGTEGSEGWDECLLNLWEFTLKEAAKEEHAVTLVPANAILDGMAVAKFTACWKRVVSDMVSGLKNHGLVADAALKEWHTKHKNSGGTRKLCEELDLILS